MDALSCPVKHVMQCVTAWGIRIPEPKSQAVLKSRKRTPVASLLFPIEFTFTLKNPSDPGSAPQSWPIPRSILDYYYSKHSLPVLSLGKESVNRQTLLLWSSTCNFITFSIERKYCVIRGSGAAWNKSSFCSVIWLSFKKTPHCSDSRITSFPTSSPLNSSFFFILSVLFSIV